MMILCNKVRKSGLSGAVAALALSWMIAMPASQAGVRDGAGGDGILVDGRLVIRDFTEISRVDVVDDQLAFLKNTPGFDSLVREISQVHPEFAARIVQDLLNAKIWLTQENIPLLPASVTSVTDSRAQVQIAVRFDDDIIISEPAFKRVPQAYILLHESLHSIVPGEGPIHHQAVRAIVRYIYENRGKLDANKLKNLLSRSDADTEYLTPATATRVRALFVANPQDPAICPLWESMTMDRETVMIEYVAGSLEQWLGMNCTRSMFFDYLAQKSPALSAYMDMNTYPIVSYMSRLEKPDFFAPQWKWQSFNDSCKIYGSTKTGAELEALAKEIQSGLAILDQAESEVSRINALTSETLDATFLKTVIALSYVTDRGNRWYRPGIPTLGSIRKTYQEKEAALKLAQATYEENLKICQKN